MSGDPTKPLPRIVTALKAGDVDQLALLFGQYPEFEQQGFIGGSSWLHYAAGHGPLNVVKCLLGRGYDINSTQDKDACSPLDQACVKNRYEIAEYLLNNGATMDTSASIRNPLFGAIVGQSPDIVKLLLNRGIDATVRYTSDTMDNMDALAFALERGLVEDSGIVIADIVALHLAKGDRDAADQLIAEANEIMMRNGRLFDLEPEHED